MKVLGQWLNNFPVGLGEFSLYANWDLLNPSSIHLSSSVLVNAIIRNMNSTGAMLYPCLAPTFKSMYLSILPMMSLNKLLSYMRFIDEHIIGGMPDFPSMVISSSRLEVSKALNRSANATNVGRLRLCIICRSFLIVNVLS